MSQKVGKNNNKVYKVVLTGGPCGGKTTGQARLCTFFENLGWKVYRVPETANILLGGGVKWTNLTEEETYKFQENLLHTMMQIENTFFDLAATCSTNCLVICDRGTMDASAYLKPEQWERMKQECGWNDVELRDIRYNQVIHMVSAADGAEDFYCTENHTTRHESLQLAKHLDTITAQSWVGHPYYVVIDNSTGFERKMARMISDVCKHLDIDTHDRLSMDSKKRKFLITELPPDSMYPTYQDFVVIHDYLVTPSSETQARIRRRGQAVVWDVKKGQWNLKTGNWTYTHTIRRPEINNERPELKMQISAKEYKLLLAQRDKSHHTVYKKRRCFLWNNQYFQLDIYKEPCHPRCQGLVILETYTTLAGDELRLPDFLNISKEVTNLSAFSMYNLTIRDNSTTTSSLQSYSIETGSPNAKRTPPSICSMQEPTHKMSNGKL